MSLVVSQMGGSRRKRGGGVIADGAMKQLQAQASLVAPAPAAKPAQAGGRRSRRLRKRSGKAHRRSTRTYSAGGRKRHTRKRVGRKHRGGSSHKALTPASVSH